MERLLQAVLAGEWPVDCAVQWIAGNTSVQPPADLINPAEKTAWKVDPPSPEGFRTFVLNYVRDQAEHILSAAEEKASGSRIGTPQASAKKFGSTSDLSRSSSRTGVEHLRALESVARRLEPGALEDTQMFPSLGSAANTRKDVPTDIIPKPAFKSAAAAAAGPTSGKRRIQPTQVAQVEVSKQFVTAPTSQPTPNFPSLASSTSNVSKAPAASSKLASRLGGGMDLGENPFGTAASAKLSNPWGKPAAAKATSTPPKQITAISSRTTHSITANVNISTRPQDICSPPGRRQLPFGPPSNPEAGMAMTPPMALIKTPRNIFPSGAMVEPSFTAAETARALTLLPLSSHGHTLAALHAGILRSSSQIYVAAEVNLLLNLLAVPLSAEVDPGIITSPGVDVLLSCGAQAQQYTAAVMQHAGELLRGLVPQLLEDIAAAAAALPQQIALAGGPSRTTSTDLSSVSSSSPKEPLQSSLPAPKELMRLFQEAATAAEMALRSRQLRTEKAFNRFAAAPGRGAVAGGFGLLAFTADGVKSRSQEEQRKLSNREACRDRFFELLRDAASKTTPFGSGGSSSGKVSYSNSGGGGSRGAPAGSNSSSTSNTAKLDIRLGGGGAPGSSLPGNINDRSFIHDDASDVAVFSRMQNAAAGLLRELRPDNFVAFAELITAAVLQAAATGVSLLDKDLQQLASKDGDRFYSLNRRMVDRGTGGRGGSWRAGVTTGNLSGATSQQQQQQQQQQQPTHFGASSNSSGSAFNLNRGNVNTSGNNRPRSALGSGSNNTMPATAGAQAAMEERVSTTSHIMAEFPSALRVYILFLEAADSHRLNTALTRVMTAKLRVLAEQGSPGKRDSGEKQSLGERVVAASALAGVLGYLSFAKNSSSGGGNQGSAEDDGAYHGRPAAWGEDPSDRYDGSHPVDVLGALRAAVGSSTMLRTLPWVLRYALFLQWDRETAAMPYFKSLLRLLGELRCAPELIPGSSTFGPAAFCLRSLLDGFALNTAIPLPSDAATATATSHSSSFDANLTSADESIDLRYFDLCCPELAHTRRLFTPEGSGLRPATHKKIIATVHVSNSVSVVPPPKDGTAVVVPAIAAFHARLSTTDPIKARLQNTFLQQHSDETSLVKLKDVVSYISDVIGFNAATSSVAKVSPMVVQAAAVQLSARIAEQAEQVTDQKELEKFAKVATEEVTDVVIGEVLNTAFEAAQEPIKIAAVRAMLSLTDPGLGDAVISTAAGIVAEYAAVACEGKLPMLAKKAVQQEVLAKHARMAVQAAVKRWKESAGSESEANAKVTSSSA